jgi:predicted transcriptional regulator of viral defense system
MRIIDIQQKLKKLNKSYYSIADLKKVFHQKQEVLRVTIHRLLKKAVLLNIEQGLYMLPDKVSKLDQIIAQIYYPCYLSFETALARYNILNQIPYALTFACYRKSKKFQIGEFTVEIKQIQKKLFFGYTLQKGLYIATPEKALLDQLYFVSLGKAKLDFDELNLHELSKTKFLKLSKKFPAPAQKLAKKLAGQFGKISITVQ